ncbi:MAG: ATP-grasp domain-containing protein [Oscillospiraceae bacterium]|nr:ATP-grasp domain-containing protein [Oscillospiraceae bacterium]
MKVYIHSFRGKPWNEECQAAYDGFRSMGVECVLFSTNEEIDGFERGDIIVGGMIITGHFLDILKIDPPNYNYPDELKDLLHRNIRTIRLKSLKNEQLPVFVKPLEEKTAHGMIIESMDNLDEYEKFSPETELLCSDVIDIVSEWRCFVRYGKIVGVQHYNGDKNIQCDNNVIHQAVSRCHDLPAGCALDFGVTDTGDTCLIEMNDGYSIGCYGLDPVEYAKLLSARWAELTGTEDECAFDIV